MGKIHIVVRHYPDRKKPCLVVEVGNQGMILATFKDKDMEKIWKRIIGNDIALVIVDDSIDCLNDLIKEVEE